MNIFGRRGATPKQSQQGMAVVEMTLVLPLMLLLLMTVGELGRMLYQYNMLTQSLRDGARYLASDATNGSTSDIEFDESTGENADLTRKLIVYGNISGIGTPLLQGLSTADVFFSEENTTHIRVDVVYSFTPIWGNTLPTFGYGSDIDLSFPLRSSIVMRVL